MIENQISAKIMEYLSSNDKKIDHVILEEASTSTWNAFRDQLMTNKESSKGVLRLSAGGHCVRKMWYEYNGVEGKPLEGRAKMTFLTGNLLEAAIVALIRLAGFNIYDCQKEVKVFNVPGHLDGKITHDGNTYILEVKSMSTRSFDKFVEEGLVDDFFLQYATQASLYCEAEGLDQFIMIAIDKNTGKLHDRIFTKDSELVRKAKGRYEVVSKITVAPTREFGPVSETKYNRSTKVYDPTGRSVLPPICTYCSFCEQHCWPNVQVEVKSGKPVHLVNEAAISI